MKEVKPRFKKIFLNKEAEKYKFTSEIIQNLPHLPIYSVKDNREVIDYFKSKEDPIGEGKEIIYISAYKGLPFKKCPGTKKLICCNYYIFSPIVNCPFDCSYCFMQDYMTNYAVNVYANIDEILEGVLKECRSHKNYFYRVGTGELGDSLALDSIVPLSRKLITVFSKIDNASLELKTKSAEISALSGIEHKNIIIAWSLNPEPIIKIDEKYTASLAERFKAASFCQKLGYKLAFHFDPIFYYAGWEKDYQKVVDQLFKNIKADNIAWISLGTFRFPPLLKKQIRERFPQSRIILEEFVLGEDGKMRYLKFIRKEVFQKMVKWIRKHSKKVPLYFCMESSEMWKAVFNGLPGKELEHIFNLPGNG